MPAVTGTNSPSIGPLPASARPADPVPVSPFPAGSGAAAAGGVPEARQIALNMSSACGPPRHSVLRVDRTAWQAWAQLAGRSVIRSGRHADTWAAASRGSAHCRPSRV